MKLSINQQAPHFSVNDVNGVRLDITQMRGRKLFLVFQRNAGCPVCNLRVNQLLKLSRFFEANDVTVVLIYESTAEKMKEYLGDTAYPFHFVADPQNKLYDAFAVEKSFGKLMKGMFHGLLAKATAGKKLFKESISQDGNMARIPAEFLIDADGKVQLAHYGEFLGDDLPLEKLKQLIQAQRPLTTSV